MTKLDIQVFAEFEAFKDTWQPLGYNKIETRQYWALLTELPSGELLIQLPDWLAEQNAGYTDGAVPTAFVGRIDEETEQAILIVDSAGAHKLSQLADRIQSLETSLARLETEGNADDERLEWLQRRLDDRRQAFYDRENVAALAEEWLPKSQIEFIGRAAPNACRNQ